MKVLVYKDVRKLFAQGKTIAEIKESLQKKGISYEDISLALTHYFQDESTNYDDTLISYIEKRYKKGHSLDIICEELIKKGHKPVEVHKALVRIDTRENLHFGSFFRGIGKYLSLQLSLIIVCIVLSILLNILFIFGALLVCLQLALSSWHNVKDESVWKSEVEVNPVLGLTVSKGYFMYASGGYGRGVIIPRFWVMHPSVSQFGLFIALSFCLLFFGQTLDFVIGLILAGISAFIGAFYKKKE